MRRSTNMSNKSDIYSVSGSWADEQDIAFNCNCRVTAAAPSMAALPHMKDTSAEHLATTAVFGDLIKGTPICDIKAVGVGVIFFLFTTTTGALRYKSEGRGFNSRWCH